LSGLELDICAATVHRRRERVDGEEKKKKAEGVGRGETETEGGEIRWDVDADRWHAHLA